MINDSILSVTYPIVEHFYTLQGEGYFSGQAAYFIRLAGCDVGCVWCDVKESWEEEGHPIMSVKELIDVVSLHPGKIVVITGGEPAMHDLTPLTSALKERGFRTHIETSGTHPLRGEWDWITLSPKKFKAPLDEIFSRANEFKVIVYHSSDLQWGEEFVSQYQLTCKLYLQPEWGKKDKVLPSIISYIQEHPQWQLSLQTHKYIHIP